MGREELGQVVGLDHGIFRLGTFGVRTEDNSCGWRKWHVSDVPGVIL